MFHLSDKLLKSVFLAEFTQRNNFENPEGRLVKNALEKRKSAFVRFGKRADEPNPHVSYK